MPTFKAFVDKKEVGMCQGADPAKLEALVQSHQGDRWRLAGDGQVLGGSGNEGENGLTEREKRLAALEKRGL